MRLFTPAFEPGGQIPAKYTCDGENVSPPLEWADVPAATISLALVVDDPDAPRGTFVHWILFGLDPAEKGLTEGIGIEGPSASGGQQGRNGFGHVGYGGPCPPSGTHRYYFRLYALDAEPVLKAGASRQDFDRAIAGHVLADAEYMGRYQRGGVEG